MPRELLVEVAAHLTAKVRTPLTVNHRTLTPYTENPPSLQIATAPTAAPEGVLWNLSYTLNRKGVDTVPVQLTARERTPLTVNPATLPQRREHYTQP